MERPHNSFDRAIPRNAVWRETDPCPDIDPELVAWLERRFPPRCYNPKNETVELHLAYAGAVSVIQDLRGLCDRQDEADAEAVSIEAETPLGHATTRDIQKAP